ncbi:PAS domain-containing sensor histidine kinase [Daejeonella oryzae]|uniref:PAS domain-containing sensor histidine kinase n=1 Tax=Daejeonella oryzae TaxID=1122943 RepID=UPI0004108B37|nr:histidine kinase [Daejeonella oryzae]
MGIVASFLESTTSGEELLRFVPILENISDFVWITDIHDRIIFINREARDALDYSETDSDLLIENLYLPSAYKIFKEEGVLSAIRTGIWKTQTTWIAKNKREIIVSQSLLCHKSKEGVPQYFSAIARSNPAVKNSEEELLKMNEQLRSLSAHLLKIREEERSRISREIHDELGQLLTGMKMDVSWINKRLKSEDSAIQNKIVSLLDLIDMTISSVRRISSDLRPGILDDFGLSEALEWQAIEFQKRSGINCHLDLRVDLPLIDKNLSITLFRIFQESLTNITKHSQAQNVWLQIKTIDNFINFRIEDDGIGMDISTIKTKYTLGLIGMQERINMVNGEFSVTSSPGNGTVITVNVPIISHPDN